jgi:hypothetical protein
MTPNIGKDNLVIFGYGSLLADPGELISPHIIARVPYPSPWPIEYARRAKSHGDGPTLVLYETGGIVRGQLLVLDLHEDRLAELTEWLWQREGRPPRELLRPMECDEFNLVLYCDLEVTLKDEDVNAESLAQFAIDSVAKNPERNGIRYLADNIEQGIVTPLSYAYRDEILRRTGTTSLSAAEGEILRSLPGRPR